MFDSYDHLIGVNAAFIDRYRVCWLFKMDELTFIAQPILVAKKIGTLYCMPYNFVKY